jgi:dihydropteroate synthase
VSIHVFLDCGSRRLNLDHPVVMGILNATPDSFSDGGRWLGRDAALRHAESMLAEGAAIIDIGGESTRPGAEPVSEQEELDRVAPLIEALAQRLDAVISADTCKPAVMRAAIAAGASMVNDVNALRAEGAVQAVAASNVAVCLMHMQGSPRSMQQAPRYADVVSEVRDALSARLLACEAAGIGRNRLAVDPGIGFGKTLAHNLSLLKGLPVLGGLGVPVLIGVSRKSMFGQLLGLKLAERELASVVTAALAVAGGAAIVRAHSVAETVQAVRIAQAIKTAADQ